MSKSKQGCKIVRKKPWEEKVPTPAGWHMQTNMQHINQTQNVCKSSTNTVINQCDLLVLWGKSPYWGNMMNACKLWWRASVFWWLLLNGWMMDDDYGWMNDEGMMHDDSGSICLKSDCLFGLTSVLTPYCFSTFSLSCLKHASKRSWNGRRASVTFSPWIRTPSARFGI